MSWKIEFTDRSRKAFGQLDKTIQKRIDDFLCVRVAPNPRRVGEALTGDRKGLWRYRVGDYRIITKIQDQLLTVLVIRVGHRKNVYD